VPDTKITGNQSSFTFNGTVIPIVKASPKVSRTLEDDTDSSNYDSASDMLHKSQTPVSTATELAIEGRFRATTTMAQIVPLLYNSNAAVAVTLKATTSIIFGHGNFDISDFSCDFEPGKMVNYTATLKSNGVFTPGS
jgi:hypothetical protein